MRFIARHSFIQVLNYSLFINDLLKIQINLNTKILRFADHTAILLSERTTDALYREANKMINNINVWF